MVTEPTAEADASQADHGCGFPVAYRGILAIAQAATIVLTWPLWEARDHPPLLPMLPLPQFDMGWPLLAGIAASCLLPRVGLPCQAAVLLWAMATDQSRIQPHVISMLYLGCGTIPGSWGGRVIARAALVSLWFFSGVHKLTSPGFFTNTAPWLAESLHLPTAGAAPWILGLSIGLTEVALAVGCLLPRTRQAVAVAAFGLHLLIALVLSPLVLDWNVAVLPWNVALAFSGLALVAPWRDALPGRAWRSASKLARGAAVALLVSPAGYWLGLVDAYLAHCLYAGNTPQAFICTPFDRRDMRTIPLDAGYLLPPAHRLFGPFFLRVGRLGEWIEIEDPRPVARWRGLAFRKIRWSDLVPAGDRRLEPPGPFTQPPPAER